MIENKINLCGKKDIYLLGDTHYPRGSRSKFKAVLDEIKHNRNARLLGFGDWIEGISHTDPRYHPEETPFNLNIDEQWATFEEDISYISDKIIGLHAGNHEHVLIVRHDTNELQKICKRHNIKYLGEGFAVHQFKGDAGTTNIASFHGVGGGISAGYAYNKLEYLSHIFGDLDVIAVGHTHKLGVNMQITPLVFGDGRLTQKFLYSCSTGSFLTNYEEDTCSYGERKGYHPLPLGYIKIEYDDGIIKKVSVCPV